MIRKFGLIGKTLQHSFSPKYFTEKFKNENINAQYLPYELEDISMVTNLLTLDGLIGFNVTIPYKEKIIDYLDELGEEAAELSAVNTVHISDGRVIGYNTDVYGFRISLLTFLGDLNWDFKALILGTGGASKAVAWVLNDLAIDHLFVSRSKGDLRYNEITQDLMNSHKLIINTTPLGTYPDTLSMPDIPIDYITENHYIFDLVYNPPATKLLRMAKQKGAMVRNGAEMLQLQADASWLIWNKNKDLS